VRGICARCTVHVKTAGRASQKGVPNVTDFHRQAQNRTVQKIDATAQRVVPENALGNQRVLEAATGDLTITIEDSLMDACSHEHRGAKTAALDPTSSQSRLPEAGIDVQSWDLTSFTLVFAIVKTPLPENVTADSLYA
jgi:hypothetical protein